MPNAHSMYAALPVALSALALASFASAGSLSVPAEFTTIQAAIDAASPGDVIVVAPGVYAEALTIPAELTGLRVKGKKGKVVVDAHLVSASVSAVISIAANDVTISDIIVSNEAGVGAEEGQGVHVTGDGVLLRRVTALNCEGIGFDLEGLLGRVRDSAVIGGGNSVPGIAMQGSATRVERTRVSGRASGVSMMGAESILRKCDIRTAATAVTSKGNGILIEGCSIRSVSGDGIAIIGEPHCDVRKNRIDAGGTAILVDIEGTPGDDAPLLIVDIADNVIGSFSHAGISSVGDDFSALRIVGNHVSGGIDGSGAGLLLASSHFHGVVDDNVVTDCACDGVVIEGANWTVSHNAVSECAEDGFDVGAVADDIVLLGNSALRCGGEGIEVGGTDISLLHNVARANHLDLAAEASATFVDVVDNDFVTGSLETPPEIGD